MKISLHTIIGLISIVLGGVIYVLFRDQSLLMFSWFDVIGLTPVIVSARDIVSPISLIIPKWFFFSLPNSMWAFGGILLFCCIWRDCILEKTLWIFVFLCISIGSEIGQLVGSIPGTYDPTDMVLMVIFILLAIFIGNTQNGRGERDAEII